MKRRRLTLEDAPEDGAKALGVKDVKKIMDSVVVLDITFHRPGIYRKANIDLVETDADKKMLRLNKDIVSRKEYTAAIAVAYEARRWLDTRCLPSLLGRGTYFLPIANIGVVTDKLEEFERRYMAKFEEFLLVYPSLVRDAESRLGNQFDPKNYPSVEQLRSAVYIERRLLDFGVPSEDKLGRALWEEERKRAESTWRSAAEEIQCALRDAFRSLVRHLAERLEPNADGSKKVFKDTAVSKLLEFIDLFKNRNLVGDAELEGLVIQARDVLKGKKPDAIRKSDVKRGEVYSEMIRVQAALETLLMDAPKRAISFDD